RPLNSNETARGDNESLNVLQDRQTLQIVAPVGEVGVSKPLTFNSVYDSSVPQEAFFSGCGIVDLIDRALEGYYTTIFAYGQTGSGKTYTITGPDSVARSSPPSQGVVPRALSYLFASIASRLPPEDSIADPRGNENFQEQPQRYTVRASYLEIHNEVVHDLLTSHPQPLSVRYKPNLGFYVENLFVVECEVLDDALAVLEEGLRNRTVGSHKMNEHSSRSHAVMTVHVDSYDPVVGVTKSGKITFVDLAGSERVSDTDSTGATFNEALSINKSLLTLGNCISALSDPKRKKGGHIPYRDSKLTKLLMDSLGGNGFALMANCLRLSVLAATD
ncbi:kinesin-domain-containing protein, partial [Gonapodya prolifera JEL478]